MAQRADLFLQASGAGMQTSSSLDRPIPRACVPNTCGHVGGDQLEGLWYTPALAWRNLDQIEPNSFELVHISRRVVAIAAAQQTGRLRANLGQPKAGQSSSRIAPNKSMPGHLWPNVASNQPSWAEIAPEIKKVGGGSNFERRVLTLMRTFVPQRPY